MKYFDENKIVEAYRTQVNEGAEGKKYRAYRRSRLNAKSEITKEAENVLLYRENFQGKARQTQKPYRISRSVKIKKENGMHSNGGIEYELHAAALAKKKLQKPYQIPRSVKIKRESEMHSNVGIEYVIHAAALAEKKTRLYRISRVLSPVKYELSNLESFLANVDKMQPAEMKVHLKKLTGTAMNPNWKKARLQAKLQQLWNVRCDSLRAQPSKCDSLRAYLSNKKTELNEADADCDIFTSFMKMVSCPAEEIRINKDGQIESTIYWKNIPIRCIYENENTVERFVYNNKEFTMEKVVGTFVQYVPTNGQQNETIEVIEIGYQIPYECCEVMKQKVPMKVFLKGGAHYAVQRSWKEGKLKIETIFLEDCKITKITSRKQLQKTYLEQLLK